MEGEAKELRCGQFDRIDEESSLKELHKVEAGLNLPPVTVENSTKTEESQVDTDFKNEPVNPVVEGKIGTSEGESFLESPSLAKVAFEETCTELEDCQAHEVSSWIEKDKLENENQLQKDQKAVEEIHVVAETDNIDAFVKQVSVDISLKNSKEDVEMVEASKLPLEEKNIKEHMGEKLPHLPITPASVDPNLHEGEMGSGESEVMEQEKQREKWTTDNIDTETVLETSLQKSKTKELNLKVDEGNETPNEEEIPNQDVETTVEQQASTEEILQSIKAEKASSVSQKDEIGGKKTWEDTDSESREQVLETIEATSGNNQQAPSHTPDFIGDRLNADFGTVTEACNNRESIDTDFGTDTAHIKQDIEETFEGVEGNGPEKSSNLVGMEKGPETINPCKKIENEKQEREEISQDSIRASSISMDMASPKIQNDEEILEKGEGINDKLDSPSVTMVTEQTSLQKVEPKIGRNLEEVSSLALEEKSQETIDSSEKMKDDIPIVDEIQDQNNPETPAQTTQDICQGEGEKLELTEASIKENKEEEEFPVTLAEEIINITDMVKAKENIEKGASNDAEKPEFLQKDEPERDKLERSLNVMREDIETAPSSADAEKSTHAKEEPIKNLEESSKEERKERETNDTDDTKENRIPKGEDLKPVDPSEKIESMEAEVPNKNTDDLPNTHILVEETAQKVGKKSDEVFNFEPEEQGHEEKGASPEEEKHIEEASEVNQSMESTIFEQEKTTDGEPTLGLTSQTSEMEVEKLKGASEVDSEEKLGSIHARENIEEELVKKEGTSDTDLHKIQTKCDETEKRTIEEEDPIKDYSTECDGDEMVEKSYQKDEKEQKSVEEAASELNDEDQSYKTYDAAKTAKNESIHEEVYEAPKIASTSEDTKKQIIEEEGTLTGLSQQSIGEESVKSSQEEQKEAEKPKGEAYEELETAGVGDDIEEHTIEEDDAVKDQSMVSIGEETVKESSQEDEKEAKMSEEQLSETLKTAGSGEDIKKQILEEDCAVKDHFTVSVEEETAKENSPEDGKDAKDLEGEVFEELKTAGAAKDTIKQIQEIGIVKDYSTVSIGEETVKESSQEDEVSKGRETDGAGEDTEKQIIKEDVALKDLSSINIGEETIKESCQEDEKEAKKLEGEVKDSDLVSIEKNFEATASTEETETVTLKNEENTNKNPDASSTAEASGEEMLPKESSEKRVETSCLVSDVSEKQIIEEIAEITSDKLDTTSVTGVTEETCIQETEPEGEKLVGTSDLASEYKGLETIETRRTSLQGEDVKSVKIKEIFKNVDKEILTAEKPEADEAEQEIKYEVPIGDPDAVLKSEDQGIETTTETEIATGKTPLDDKLEENLQGSSTLPLKQQEQESTDGSKKKRDETPVKGETQDENPETPFVSHTTEEMSMENEEEPRKPEEISEMGFEDIGKETPNEELQKDEDEYLEKPPEKHIYESKESDAILEREKTTELTEASESSKSKALVDEETQELGLKTNILEGEKPFDEVSKVLETIDACADTEKDILEQKNSIKIIEECFKEGMNIEDAAVELEAVSHTHETNEASNTTNSQTLPVENLEEIDPGGKLEKESRSMAEDQSNETLSETKEAKIEENSEAVKDQKVVSVENQMIGERFQKEEKGPKFQIEDQSNKTNHANESIKNTKECMETEDAAVELEVPQGVEKVDDDSQKIDEEEATKVLETTGVCANTEKDILKKEDFVKNLEDNFKECMETEDAAVELEAKGHNHETNEASDTTNNETLLVEDLEAINPGEKLERTSESIVEEKGNETIPKIKEAKTEEDNEAAKDQKVVSVENYMIGERLQEEESGRTNETEPKLEAEDHGNKTNKDNESTRNTILTEEVQQEVEKANEYENIKKLEEVEAPTGLETIGAYVDIEKEILEQEDSIKNLKDSFKECVKVEDATVELGADGQSHKTNEASDTINNQTLLIENIEVISPSEKLKRDSESMVEDQSNETLPETKETKIVEDSEVVKDQKPLSAENRKIGERFQEEEKGRIEETKPKLQAEDQSNKTNNTTESIKNAILSEEVPQGVEKVDESENIIKYITEEEEEAAKGLETIVECVDTEKDILKKENSFKNLEDNFKEYMETEDAAVELEAEGHAHGTNETSDTTNNETLLVEDLEAIHLGEKLERTSKSMVEEKSNETIPKIKEAKIEEDNEAAKDQKVVSVENHMIEERLQEKERGRTKETEPKLEAEDHGNKTKKDNESTTNTILTEEVQQDVEKADENENIKKHNEEEAPKGLETIGACVDIEKDILEQEDSIKNLEDSFKECVKVEDAIVQLVADSQSHETNEASDTINNQTLLIENIKAISPSEKLERDSESMAEDQSNETLLKTKVTKIVEDCEVVKDQKAVSAENRKIGERFQEEEEGRIEETKPKFQAEDQSNKTNNANESIKNAILSEEVPQGVEKVDESENIKKHITKEEEEEEAVKGFETIVECVDTEKDILKQEDSFKNLEDNFKECMETKDTAIELEAEGHNHETNETSDTTNNETLLVEDLVAIHLAQKLERTSESMVEEKSNETILKIKEAKIKEYNEAAKVQKVVSVEKNMIEERLQEEEMGRTEETEPKLEAEDHGNKTNKDNESTKNTIVTEEVQQEVEKANEYEKTKTHEEEEAPKGLETISACVDIEKDILEQEEDSIKNLEYSFRECVKVEDATVELGADGQSHETNEVSDTINKQTLLIENIETISPGEKLKRHFESMVEYQSNETLSETKENKIVEDSEVVKDQKAVSAENQKVGGRFQEEEKRRIEETKAKLQAEDQSNKTNNTNESIKNTILSEEVPQRVEKVDESENIKKHITEEETAKGLETIVECVDIEKDIFKQEDSFKNLEDNFKECMETEDTAVELEAEGHNHETNEASNTTNNKTLLVEDLEAIHPGEKLERTFESMVEEKSNETIPKIKETKTEEDNEAVKDQKVMSVENQMIGERLQEEESGSTKETEIKLEVEDQSNKTNKANESTKNTILIEEVPQKVEKVDECENIKKHITEEEETPKGLETTGASADIEKDILEQEDSVKNLEDIFKEGVEVKDPAVELGAEGQSHEINKASNTINNQSLLIENIEAIYTSEKLERNFESMAKYQSNETVPETKIEEDKEVVKDQKVVSIENQIIRERFQEEENESIKNAILSEKVPQGVEKVDERENIKKQITEEEEASKGLETIAECVDTENDILKQEYSVKNLEDSFKECMKTEDVAVELKAEGHSHETNEVSDTTNYETFLVKDLEAINPGEKLERTFESMGKEKSNETTSKIKEAKIEEDNEADKDQNDVFVENQMIGERLQEEERGKTEETEPKLKVEDHSNKTNKDNESTKNTILTEEAPQEVEKVDECENIKKYITEEEEAAKGLETTGPCSDIEKEILEQDDSIKNLEDSLKEGVKIEDVAVKLGANDQSHETNEAFDTTYNQTILIEVPQGVEKVDENENTNKHITEEEEEAKGLETIVECADTEKDILKQDDFVKNLTEFAAVELEAESHSHETNEAFDTTNSETLLVENLAVINLGEKLERTSESMAEEKSNETIPEIEEAKIEKDSEVVKDQKVVFVENQMIGEILQEEERGRTKEIESKLEAEDHSNKTNKDDENTKNTILTEEVPQEVEKCDERENIKKHITEEEEAPEGMETTGACADFEKDIMEQEDSVKNLEDSFKEELKVENASTELRVEGHSHETNEASETINNQTLLVENIEAIYQGENLESNFESMAEDQSNETLPETKETKIEEDKEAVKDQKVVSVESQMIEEKFQDEDKWRTEETESRMEAKDRSNKTNNENESIKKTSLTEEAPRGVEEADESETIKKQIIEEEVRVSDQVSTKQNFKGTDPNEKIETVNSKDDGDPNKKPGPSPVKEASDDEIIQKEGSEKLVDVSNLVSKVSEENIKEISEETHNKNDKLHIAFVSVLTEVTSLREAEPEGEKLVGTFDTGSEEESLGTVETAETSLHGEEVESMKLDETSELVSQLPNIEGENTQKESLTVEKLDADEVEEEIQRTSNTVSESENQCLEATAEAENPGGWTLTADKSEEKLQKLSTPLISEEQQLEMTTTIEKIKDEILTEDETQEKRNPEAPFSMETTEETCLQKEKPRELEASEMQFEDIKKENPNEEPKVKEGEKLDEASKLDTKSVSETKAADTLLEKGNIAELTEPREKSINGTSKEEVLEVGQQKDESEAKKPEKPFAKVCEELEAGGASTDTEKNVQGIHDHLKNPEENSEEDENAGEINSVHDSTTKNINPKEENFEAIGLGKMVETEEGENPNKNANDLPITHSSVEEALAGGKCEASNREPEKIERASASVSEVQSCETPIETEEKEIKEYGGIAKDQDTVSVGNGRVEQSFQEDEKKGEHIEEALPELEGEEDQCEKKTEADETSKNEISTDEITKEKEAAKGPYLISLGEETVKEIHQEDEKKGKEVEEAATKLDLEDQSDETICRNDTTETKILKEEKNFKKKKGGGLRKQNPKLEAEDHSNKTNKDNESTKNTILTEEVPQEVEKCDGCENIKKHITEEEKGPEGMEIIGACANIEKDIMEQEDSVKNLEDSFKEGLKVEDVATELGVEGHSHETNEASETINNQTLLVENIEAIYQGENLESNSESMAEDQSNETLPETKETKIEEDGEAVKDQKVVSVENQMIGERFQEEDKWRTEETESKLEAKDHSNKTNNENESIKKTSLTEEAPRGVEEADESENIKKQIIEDEVFTKDLHTVSIGEETVYEVRGSDEVSTKQDFKGTDSDEKIETVNLKDDGDPNKKPGPSPVKEASDDKIIQKEGSEKLVDVSSLVSKGSEENITEISEETHNRNDKLHTAFVTVLTEVTSLREAEPEGEKLVEVFDTGSEQKSLVTVETAETSLQGEEVKSVKLDETSELVSQLPTIEGENTKKESLTVEKLDADEVEEIQRTSDTVSESENQCFEATAEAENPSGWTLTEDKSEEKLQKLSSPLISEEQELEMTTTIEKIKDEILTEDETQEKKNPEVPFDMETTEETCLHKENPRELEASEMGFEDIKKENPNEEPKVKEGEKLDKASKLDTKTCISETKAVDSVLERENIANLSEPREKSINGTSKEEEVLEVGQQKDESEAKKPEKPFGRVCEDLETGGASIDTEKNVQGIHDQLKNPEEDENTGEINSVHDSTENGNPKEEYFEAIGLGKMVETEEGENPNKNADDLPITHSSVEEALVRGKYEEASNFELENIERASESVSEVQSCETPIETEGKEIKEYGGIAKDQDTVSAGNGRVEQSFQEDEKKCEHIEEALPELEGEEDQCEKKTEADETSKNEISTDEITEEKEAAKDPYLISLGEETVEENYEENEMKGKEIQEAATKLDLEDQSCEIKAEEDQGEKTNESNKTTKNGTLNEELSGGVEKVASENNEKWSKEPYLVSVREETVTESHQEDAKKGKEVEEAAIKLDLEDQSVETICRNDTTETKILKKEVKSSDLVLVEPDLETIGSNAKIETVIIKDEEDPDGNLDDPPATNTPDEKAPQEKVGGILKEVSELVPEEPINETNETNEENMEIATEDTGGPEDVMEIEKLKSISSELAYNPGNIAEGLNPKDQEIHIDKTVASPLAEGSQEEIPDKGDVIAEDAKSHDLLFDKHITAEVSIPTEEREAENIKDEASVEEILTKGHEKKLEEDKFHKTRRANDSGEPQIPKQEQALVLLSVEQTTAERSIRDDSEELDNTSNLVLEAQGNSNHDLVSKAQIHESLETKSRNLEDAVSLNEKLDVLSHIQPSGKEISQKPDRVELAEANEIARSIEKLEKTSDATSEQQTLGEADPIESTETKISPGNKDIPSRPQDPVVKILQKAEVEDREPRKASETESEVSGVERGGEKKTDDAAQETVDESKPMDTDGVLLSDLLQRSTKETLQMAGHLTEDRKPTVDKEEMETEEAETVQEEEAETVQVEGDKDEEGEEEHEHKKEDSGSDAPVMVEASRDVDVKPMRKKSHNIFSGVGSKVKHSIAKVKKAITGKSSHPKPLSPK